MNKLEIEPNLDSSIILCGAGKGEPVVKIAQEISNFIETFAKEDTTKERGGILVGSFEKLGKNKLSITIKGAIEAKYTDASSVSLKFTHETWNDIHNVKDERYPEDKIIGWFHTHPGLGVFLSGYDLFIHRNFFKEPWQVAYVVDPVRNTRKIFYWNYKSIIPAGKQTTAESDEEPINSRPYPSYFTSRFSKIALYFIVFLIGMLVGLLISNPIHYPGKKSGKTMNNILGKIPAKIIKSSENLKKNINILGYIRELSEATKSETTKLETTK